MHKAKPSRVVAENRANVQLSLMKPTRLVQSQPETGGARSRRVATVQPSSNLSQGPRPDTTPQNRGMRNAVGDSNSQTSLGRSNTSGSDTSFGSSGQLMSPACELILLVV